MRRIYADITNKLGKTKLEYWIHLVKKNVLIRLNPAFSAFYCM